MLSQLIFNNVRSKNATSKKKELKAAQRSPKILELQLGLYHEHHEPQLGLYHVRT